MFSHQVYWYKLTENKPKLNAGDKELENDAHKWLKTSNKNVIVISGDYGRSVPETFCEYDKSDNILYIARITDTNLFDAMFVDVLTAKLAVDLAYPVTSSMAVQKQMQDLFQKKLSEARSIDGQEGFMDDLVSDTFTDFRK